MAGLAFMRHVFALMHSFPLCSPDSICVLKSAAAVIVGVSGSAIGMRSSTVLARLAAGIDALSDVLVLLWDDASLIRHPAPQPVRAHKVGRLQHTTHLMMMTNYKYRNGRQDPAKCWGGTSVHDLDFAIIEGLTIR